MAGTCTNCGYQSGDTSLQGNAAVTKWCGCDKPLPEHRLSWEGCACGDGWSDDYDCCLSQVSQRGMNWDRKTGDFASR